MLMDKEKELESVRRRGQEINRDSAHSSERLATVEKSVSSFSVLLFGGGREGRMGGGGGQKQLGKVSSIILLGGKLAGDEKSVGFLFLTRTKNHARFEQLCETYRVMMGGVHQVSLAFRWPWQNL